ncbi:MAG: D-alanyl-D-alanine carboxypeptidase [Hyphomicrobiaceae bacterium]|nr:D-alanyl-D-alanine carboxypeptidase [Hyphomicrobiaceae bacterium]
MPYLSARLRHLSLGLSLLAVCIGTATAPARAETEAPVQTLARPVSVDVGAYLVFDVRSGEVLTQQNASHAWYPASVTKLMTAYTVFQAMRARRIGPNSPVVVSAEALRQPPSKMGLKVGTVLTVDNALKMIMVKSANDITYALAEAASGSMPAFSQEMNAWSRKLGMVGSYWDNPHGLPDDDQRTTARDLAVLARALIHEFPEHQDLYDIQALEFAGKLIPNHNHLLERYPGSDGMKTGFICAAGFNVVATATRGGRRLGVIILGARNARERSEKAAELFTRAFRGEFNGGGWGFGSSTQTVERMPRGPESANPPRNMKPLVCGAGRNTDVGEEAMLEAPRSSGPAYEYDDNGRMVYKAGAAASGPRKIKIERVSWLSPRQRTREPVKVWIGGADGASPTAIAAAPAAPIAPVAAAPVANAFAARPQVLPDPAAMPAAAVAPVAASAASLPGSIMPTRALPPTGPGPGAGVVDSLKPADGKPMVLMGTQPVATANAAALPPVPSAAPSASRTLPGSLVPVKDAKAAPAKPLMQWNAGASPVAVPPKPKSAALAAPAATTPPPAKPLPALTPAQKKAATEVKPPVAAPAKPAAGKTATTAKPQLLPPLAPATKPKPKT